MKQDSFTDTLAKNYDRIMARKRREDADTLRRDALTRRETIEATMAAVYDQIHQRRPAEGPPPPQNWARMRREMQQASDISAPPVLQPVETGPPPASSTNWVQTHSYGHWDPRAMDGMTLPGSFGVGNGDPENLYRENIASQDLPASVDRPPPHKYSRSGGVYDVIDDGALQSVRSGPTAPVPPTPDDTKRQLDELRRRLRGGRAGGFKDIFPGLDRYPDPFVGLMDWFDHLE